MSIKQAIEALEEVADRLDGIKGGSVSESIQMLRTAIANLRLASEAVLVDGSFPPRNIIFDSLHPDYPVEWSNPGRPAREGEVHYIRYDLFSDAVYALAAMTEPVFSTARGVLREDCNYMTPCGSVCRKCGEVHQCAALAALRSMPAEPVAWLYKTHAGDVQAFTSEPPPRLKELCQPLFATPHTTPVLLTDEQIDAIEFKPAVKFQDAFREYARAIERAVLGRGGEK